MLSHPTGVLRSVRSRNIEDSLVLDWLEATSLFMADELSQTDVVDYLVQEQICEEQDSASEYVMWAWTELDRRLSWLGAYAPIAFQDRWMTRRKAWKDVPAHSFCLVVSLGPRYDGWHRDIGPDYSHQGRLFELITKAAMEAHFSGWQFLETGWSRDNASKLVEVIDKLIANLGERKGNPNDYLNEDAKDAGVDLVWHRPFADSRGGAPIYLAQCASGKNWIDKVNEPNIGEWTKIVDFAAPPSKAFSLPYALSNRELRRQSNRAGGLIVDRYRLLAQNVCESAWIPRSLCQQLIAWLEPRIYWMTSR